MNEEQRQGSLQSGKGRIPLTKASAAQPDITHPTPRIADNCAIDSCLSRRRITAYSSLFFLQSLHDLIDGLGRCLLICIDPYIVL